MPIVLCHSPKGGVGTTFLAAHLAMGLAEMGGVDEAPGEVALLTLSARDLTGLHFGLAPAQQLPPMATTADAAVLVGGIGLFCEPEAADDSDFLPRLEDAGYLAIGSDRTLVIDVPTGHHALARKLMRHAALHLCPLTASPDCLALLPQLLDEAGDRGPRRTAYVFGKLDETRRLARHVAAFAREVLGERLIAKIRNDQAVPEALAMLQLLSRYAPASAALADARLAAQAVAAILAQERAAVAGVQGDEADASMDPFATARMNPAAHAGTSRAA
jgi:cellulose biosynthesis protein BcsQ